jgi:SET domain-containing protein
VFALQDIAEGETLIEYVGEIITWKEAQRRHPHDPEDPEPHLLLPRRRRTG